MYMLSKTWFTDNRNRSNSQKMDKVWWSGIDDQDFTNKWAKVRKYARLWESETSEHGFIHSQDRSDCQKKNVARTGAIAREKQTLTIRNWWTGYTQWSSSVIRLNKYHASRQHGKHICTMSHNLGEISGLRYPIWVAQISVLLHEHETPRFKAKNLRSRHTENQTVCISLKRCCPSQRSVYIRRESIGRSSSPKDKIVHIEKRSMFSH